MKILRIATFVMPLLLVSCSVVQPVATTPSQPQSKDAFSNYIAQYGSMAVDQMKKYGIPASITLAQGLLESDAGRSTLAVKCNNHFGIKCHNDWTGKKIYVFATSGGSGIGKTAEKLAPYVRGGEIVEAKLVKKT